MLISAGLIPLVICALTIRSRRSIETSVITSLVAMLWFVGAAVLPATLLIFPSTHVFTQLASGLTRWDQLLTTPLPAPSSGSWLVLPVVTIWVGSAIASEIALRTRRALLAVMPLMTSYGIAIPFGIGAQASQLPSAACFLLGAGTLAIVVSPRYSKGTGVGQTTPTSIGKVFIPPFVAVGLVAGSLVIAPLLPGVHGANPYDPRAGRVPPAIQVVAINPLAELSNWAINPNQVLFRVTSTRPERLVLAILDQYDAGSGWTSTTSFVQFGPRLSAAQGVAGPTNLIIERIAVGNTPGPWLPAAANPVSISGVQALANLDTGVLLDPAGSVAGIQYTVVAQEPRNPPNCAPYDAAPDPAVISTVPFAIRVLAQSVVEGEPTACDQAQALTVYLRQHFRFSRQAPSGTTVASVMNFLFGKKSTGGRIGTSEQFASAFALLGQAIGLDTRIVVGFLPSEKGQHETIRAGDALAWPEVDFSGLGWVTFDPTPLKGTTAPTPPPRVETPPTPPVTIPQPSTQSLHGKHPSSSQNKSKHSPRSSGWITLLLVAVGGLIILLSAVLASVGMRRRYLRRRRLKASSNRLRIHGAWLEARDALADVGVRSDFALTASEVVAESRDRCPNIGVEQLGELGQMVNAAVFSANEPAQEFVTRAWQRSDEFVRTARHSLPKRRQVARAFDVRILVRSSSPRG